MSEDTNPTPKRQCFTILPAQRHPERGYIPSVVTEGEAGHSPLIGNGPGSEPWYWGTDWDKAQRIVEEENRRTFGLEPAEAKAIVDSSIAAQIRLDARSSELHQRVERATGDRW